MLTHRSAKRLLGWACLLTVLSAGCALGDGGVDDSVYVFNETDQPIAVGDAFIAVPRSYLAAVGC